VLADGGGRSPPPRAARCPVCEMRQEQTRRRDQQEVGSHSVELKWVLAQQFPFTAAEKKFLENITAWKGELTEKQSAWFQTIAAKVRKAAECEF
jgi:hypothetical protein